jgi:hypothetical protein
MADGVITNGTTIKVHSGTYFIESGNRTIQNNALFDIWGYSTINGLLLNSGDYQSLIIESDINGTGSLIYTSGTPQATVERYLIDDMWHMIGPPTDNVLTQQYFFNYSPSVWIKDYNEFDDTYNYITSLSVPMQRGKGYAYWVGASKTDVITEIHGPLGASNFSVNSGTNPAMEFTDINHGYNLIANPYASAIEWDGTNWSMTNMEETIWVWDPLYSGGSFRFKSSSGTGNTMTSGIIPSSQGFFIRAQASNASLTIPASSRIHSSQALYKSESDIQEEMSYIALRVVLNDYWDDITVGFSSETTDDFDNGIDVTKLFGNDDVPQLYLQEERTLLSVDIFEELNTSSRTVALKLRAPQTDTYLINLREIQNMGGVQIYLEDLQNGNYTNLKEQPTYKFSANADDNDSRFLLHFNPTVLSTNDIDPSDPNIYSFNRAVYISLNSYWANQAKTVFIYDITGRLLYTSKYTVGDFYKIPSPVYNQALIIKLQFHNQSFTKKLML